MEFGKRTRRGEVMSHSYHLKAGRKILLAVALTVPLLHGSAVARSVILAQAGSAGGSIGLKGKSAAGSVAPKSQPRRMAKPSVRVQRPGHKTACPDIAGHWSSWASGLFGQNDTVFNADGTAYHSAGISGKWFCQNGQLHIEWPDGKPGRVKLSADGKKLLDSL